MGILENLKNQVEKLGDKAKEGLDDAKDRAGDLLGDAKDRAGDLIEDAKGRLGHDDETPPLTESSDVGPDSSSTDAVQPGYVTAEDDDTEESDESSLGAEAELDAEDDPVSADGAADLVDDEESLVTEPAEDSDVVPPAAAELDPVDLDAEETAADTDDDLSGEALVAGRPVGSEPAEPAVEKDVDPYDSPLTSSIGDEIADALVDREAVVDAVDDDRDARA